MKLQKWLQQDEDEKIPKQNCILIIRLIIIFLLICIAVVVGTMSFTIIRNYESDRFTQQYDSATSLISASINKNIQRKNDAGLKIAQIFSKSFDVSKWPNVTLVGFNELCIHDNIISQSRGITFQPIVTTRNRKSWEEYATQNVILLSNDMSLQQSINGSWPVSKGIYSIAGTIYDSYYTYDSELDTDTSFPNIKAPYWQIAPPTNLNLRGTMLNSHKYSSVSHAIDVSITTKQPAISDVIQLIIDPTYRPSAFIMYPILNPLHVDVYPLGFISVGFSWDDIISQVLPSTLVGVEVVMTSPTVTVTYSVDGSKVSIKGIGDLHDRTFDTNRYAAHIYYNYTLSKLHSSDPTYTFEIYPTIKFQNLYYSNVPRNAAIAAECTIILIGILFLFYEYSIHQNKKKLISINQHTSEIANHYYPHNIAQRLFQQRHEFILANQKKIRSKRKSIFDKMKDPSALVRNPTRVHQDDVTVLSLSSKISPRVEEKSEKIRGQQNSFIAEYHEDVTVLFADISGFTTWSSTRTPVEVFLLLESLFSLYDNYAELHGIFKIETVGDW